MAGEALGLGDGEDVGDVLLAVVPGEARLRGVIDGATDDAAQHGQTGAPCDAPGDILALVVAASPQAPPVEGQGEQGIDALEEVGGEEVVGEHGGEVGGKVGLLVVLERMDEGAHLLAVLAETAFGSLNRYLAPEVALDHAMLRHASPL